MTCIAGLIDKENSTIYMGCDSAGVGGSDLRIRKDPKVFIRGPFIIGFTTSFRMGQLLMMDGRLNIPNQKPGQSDFEYMVSSFIPAIQLLFEQGGFMQEKDKVKIGGTFLVGYKTNLYSIESDFQVGELVDDYNACGCGENYAMGSLYSTRNTTLSPGDRVLKALNAAEYFSAGVRGPFDLQKLQSI